MIRRWRVYCQAVGTHGARLPCTCGFSGYRHADTREGAEAKPCPRCGCPVSALASQAVRRERLAPVER